MISRQRSRLERLEQALRQPPRALYLFVGSDREDEIKAKIARFEVENAVRPADEVVIISWEQPQ